MTLTEWTLDPDTLALVGTDDEDRSMAFWYCLYGNCHRTLRAFARYAIKARTACMVGLTSRRISLNIVEPLHGAAGIGIFTITLTFTWAAPRLYYTGLPKDASLG